jgi:hypothetical protein
MMRDGDKREGPSMHRVTGIEDGNGLVGGRSVTYRGSYLVGVYRNLNRPEAPAHLSSGNQSRRLWQQV